MASSAPVLTGEGLETLIGRVAQRLSQSQEVMSLLALNRITVTATELRQMLETANVQMHTATGMTIKPTARGHRVLLVIGPLIADAINEELGTVIAFTMTT